MLGKLDGSVQSVGSLVTLSRFHTFWVTALLVVAFLVFGIGLFPARWLLDWYAQQIVILHLSEVRGTVWRGQARLDVGTGYDPLQIKWHLSGTALWADIRGRVSWNSPHSSGRLHFVRLGNDDWCLQTVRASVPAQWLADDSSHVRGQLHLFLAVLELRNAWPSRLQGTFRWDAANLQTPNGILDLGTVRGSIGIDSQGLPGGKVSNSDGAVSLYGRFRITPLGLAFNGRLKANNNSLVPVPWSGRAHADGIQQVRFGVFPPDLPELPIPGFSQRASRSQIKQRKPGKVATASVVADG